MLSEKPYVKIKINKLIKIGKLHIQYHACVSNKQELLKHMSQTVQTIGKYTKRDISLKDKYVEEACTTSFSIHPIPLRICEFKTNVLSPHI